MTLLLFMILGFSRIALTSEPRSVGASDGIYVRIIVVSSAEQAHRIIHLLKAGEDFAALARTHSIDSTAEDGGYLGKVSRSMLRPELRDALAGVGPGQISGVTKTPLGYAILKIESQPKASASDAAATGGTPATISTGSVKDTLSVSGLGEAELGFNSMQKAPDWDQNLAEICASRKVATSGEEIALQNYLDEMNIGTRSEDSTSNRFSAYFALAEMASYQGHSEVAVERYNAAYKFAEEHVPQARSLMNEALGIAHLHKSEMDNDVYRHPGERCLLPMLPANKYLKTKDSKAAAQYFLKYLDENPDDLEVQWLLNLTYMTLGEYPAKVPGRYLIPPSVFDSGESVGRFRDVAPEAGLDDFSTAGGVIVDDFENSGRFDIVKSAFDSCEPLRFYHNNGDGTFTDEAAKVGLSDQLGGLNIVQTDYNNDGCLDILVMRGGWEIPQRRSLLRNNCDGTFTDVTEQSGLAVPATSSQAGVWVDINNDGLLDLFIGNENGPAQLFLNKGNGKFEDISVPAGVSKVSFAKGVAAADFDNDGYMDLFVSNLGGPNFLYRNNHDNTFTEVAESAGVQGPTRGFATWFFDYDNDGWPDLFVTSYFVSLQETARTYLGLPHNATTLKLYRNLGNGTFRDVTKEVGLDKVFMPMGANFGDIDNDGFLDIYLGTGNPSYGSLMPNVLLRNKEGKSFVDVTTSSGTGEWHKGHGVAFADLDNDGDEDIIADIGGATPGDRHAMRVFENPGNRNDWISLKLVGVKTNRAAIGARIKVTVENSAQGVRSIYRTVGSGGSFGASPLEQHIGLGPDARIVDLEIWWPVSNTRQHFSSVEKNQAFKITELSPQLARIERNPYRLGAPNREDTLIARQHAIAPKASK